MNILTLNVGSSSLKFGIYRCATPDPVLLLEGEIITRTGGSTIRYRAAAGKDDVSMCLDADGEPLSTMQRVAGLHDAGRLDLVAHRVVHGGPWVRTHCAIDDHVLDRIEAAASFAPLHVPPALRWIKRVSDTWPGAQQFACLDTAFHHPLPDLARVLPLPREPSTVGVERYGFHGLSCESILHQLGRPPARLVIAHLGSGASLTAVHEGRSVDTSMGMTPSGGILMGSRPGDLDPGVMLYLLRNGHCTPDELEDMLDHRAGLRGISGSSADVRELAQATDDPLATLALAQFAQSVAKQAAAMAVVLGGMDLLVFTGGIGEHHAPTRDQVMSLLQPCFPRLVSRVLPSQENLVMARHAQQLAAR